MVVCLWLTHLINGLSSGSSAASRGTRQYLGTATKRISGYRYLYNPYYGFTQIQSCYDPADGAYRSVMGHYGLLQAIMAKEKLLTRKKNHKRDIAMSAPGLQQADRAKQ